MHVSKKKQILNLAYKSSKEKKPFGRLKYNWEHIIVINLTDRRCNEELSGRHPNYLLQLALQPLVGFRLSPPLCCIEL